MDNQRLNFDGLRIVFKEAISHSFESGDISALNVTFDKYSASDNEKKTAMDQAFRDKVLELIIEKPEKLEKFVTFCVECCRRQMATATMPVVLLGDIFDSITLDKFEEMFSYVENNVCIWKEELFFMACKNNLLRMCNDLLRRLSRSQNTTFCGRILLFLAKFFPFSERSGLNIVSEFNLENLTEFGQESTANIEDAMSVDDNEKSSGKLSIDYNLYCKFWALQDFFRNPNSCYNKLQWKTFVAHSQTVLSAFTSSKLESISLEKSKEAVLKLSSSEHHYFAKYLTNQKLLELQLSDGNFRRYVLVQYLILFQYLTTSVKFKSDSQELKTEQLEWVKEKSNLIYRLLSETPPHGQEFTEAVKQILAREDYWNKWKNDGCPEVKKPKLSVPVEGDDKLPKSKKKRKLLGDIVKEYENHGKYFLGSSELSKLWNLNPDNLAACRDNGRDFMPSLEDYLLEGRKDRHSEGAWGWRALRLLATKSPHFFSHSNNVIVALPTYLDDMIRRLTREVAARKALESESGDKIVVKSEESEFVSEEQMEAELIKQEDTSELEQQAQEAIKDDDIERVNRPKPVAVTPELIAKIAKTLGADWRKLGHKLGYKPDELDFMETENATDVLRAKNLLTLWFDDDEDASIENLAYISEGLELYNVHAMLSTKSDNAAILIN